MITGNCLCGEVVYQLSSDIKTIVFCQMHMNTLKMMKILNENN